jgi:hypothetical protein
MTVLRSAPHLLVLAAARDRRVFRLRDQRPGLARRDPTYLHAEAIAPSTVKWRAVKAAYY